MNPANIFGRQQGAFQAPSNSNQSSGMFQPFGQQSSGNPTQNVTFEQTSAFGQPSAFSQPSVFGQTSGQTSGFVQSPSFGQTPAFGQSGGLAQGSGQSSAFTSFPQTPAFGQSALGQNTLAFGPPPSYAQSTGQSQGSVFGQKSAFGQPSAFGNQTTGFGLSTSIAQGSSTSGSSGQPVSFVQPSAFSQPTGMTSSSSSGQGFGTNFSFKPSNEAVFKPIFSASPEPNNPQPVPPPNPFGSSTAGAPSNTDSGGTGGFSFHKSGQKIGFSFSQPAAAPSISASSGKIPQLEPVTASGGLQFTFSQPANPSSSTTSFSQTSNEPTTPSSFSFSAKVLQPKAETKMPGMGFNPEATQSIEERGGDEESTGELPFGSLGKGKKRKEESDDSTACQEKTVKAEDPQAGIDASRHPPKRPLLRTRGPASGLFRSAIGGLMKSNTNPTKEAKKEAKGPSDWGQIERPGPPVPTAHVPVNAPKTQAPTQEVLEKAEESAPEVEPEAQTPARHARRRESMDSLSGLSPTDATVIQCKGIPANLNRKDLIMQHFSSFGKVHRVLCRPQKNLAIVYFQDHASAALARKRGKTFHKHEILIFWQRKKTSQGDKLERPPEGKGSESEGAESGDFRSSPLRKPMPRPPAMSSSVSLVKESPVKKSSVAKTLQFDGESQRDTGSERPNWERPASSIPSSLMYLVGQIAETAEEKYRLLEQRDKILRQDRPKRTDLDLSKVFVGTCPDMCPERERYMRETRNQLSVFELIPDTERVDHFAAIKEYSRSSADQEEPPPHELRPLSVLGMTMDYLVTQIMDQGEGNYRDWYDFVWNRTRGIRKDITQQHLCDPMTVSLIEKCTRFHIHCAHHLCQEPMMSFDTKINNENMTKCLQSLKEMYQDLASREVYCPHEAEFRQYNVLLKLNDSDILREIQQFRQEVRNSPEVKFAVQVFAALNSNNFVRFFKLVNAASYLSSCILHRYFNQVWREALRALNVAYTVGSQRTTIFPVEDLVRMLMFRNAAEATDFVQQYGLNVTDGMVELSRTAYQEPELTPPQRKSVAIERKRTVLIGEVVNGGLLPNPPRHTPVCSFDSNNKYTGEMLCSEPLTVSKALPQRLEGRVMSDLEVRPLVRQRLGADAASVLLPAQPPLAEEAGESTQPALAPPATDTQLLFQPIVPLQPAKTPSPPPEPQPVYSDKDVMAEVDTMVEEVLRGEVSDMATCGADYVSTALSESDSQLEALVGEVLDQMLRDVSVVEITAEKERIAEEKRKLEEARLKEEHEAFLASFSADLCSEISEELLTECVKEMADSEIKLAVEEKAACVARCTEEECNCLVDETLDVVIGQLAKEVLDVELRRIHKFIKRWRDVVAVRRQLKRQMRGFPAAPCCVDPRFKLKAFFPSAPSSPSLEVLAQGLVHLGNAGNMAVSCTRILKMRQEAVHQMRVHFYYNQLLSERVWMPLDLPSLVTESLPSPPERIFWKATVLLPSSHENETSISNRILTDWLEVKLGGGEKTEESTKDVEGRLKTLSLSNDIRHTEHKIHKVHVCIKACHGPLSEEGQSLLEEQKELSGTSALLMLLPPLPGQGSQGEEGEEDVPLLSALLQLRQLQQASASHCPLPLAVVVPGQPDGATSSQRLEEDLCLKTLVEDGLVSEYILVHIPETTNDMQGSQQVGEAIRWLAARAPEPASLSCQTLVHFVEAGLCREFSARLYHDKQDRAAAGLSCQDPAPIIQLYNTVLRFLAELISSERLAILSWPPSEFAVPESRGLVPHLGWNSPPHLAWLKRAILSLCIPDWDLPPADASWPRLCDSMFQYVSQIPTSEQSQPLLMSRLENLLGRVRSQCRPAKSEDDEDEEEKYGPSFSDIPWDEIVAVCIDHRLKDWQPPECPVAKDAISDDGEILVYFLKDGLKSFQPPDSWLRAVNRTHQEKHQETEDGSQTQPRQTPAVARGLPRQKLFQSLIAEEATSVLDITHTPSAQELLPHRVLASIQEEKAQSQRFEEQLQRWLEEDALDSLSIPLFLPSTLLSVPEIITPSRRAAKALVSQAPLPDVDADDSAERTGREWQRGIPVSIAQRLKDLNRLISANREEELACSLKLSSLLDIVDD